MQRHACRGSPLPEGADVVVAIIGDQDRCIAELQGVPVGEQETHPKSEKPCSPGKKVTTVSGRSIATRVWPSSSCFGAICKPVSEAVAADAKTLSPSAADA